ncbi:MAG TPA: FecR domain-containing protein [Lacipirellulaceae bacterium]
MDRRTSIDEETLIAERAAEWLHRLDTADLRDKEDFLKWLSRSPQNSGEALVAASTDILLRQLFRARRIDIEQFMPTAANVFAVGGQKHAPQQSRPRARWRLMATAGLGIAAAIAALFLMPPVMRGWLYPNEYTTSVGEQRAIELPDGSAIAINAQSNVRVAFSEHARDVYLNAGQAMFTVAKDPSRPFRVHVLPDGKDPAAGKDTVIQALGTKFDVRRRSGRINVAVIEGVVQIQSDARDRSLNPSMAEINEHARVAAGLAVSIESTGLITPPAPISVSDVSAWQQRRLVFTDNTLEEITEEFRRYNRTPRIHIEDEELRRRRLSGVFDADYPEALLLYLASDDAVVLDRQGEDLIIRRRPVTVQSQIIE